MPTGAADPTDPQRAPRRLGRRPRRVAGLAVVVGILLTFLSALTPATAVPTSTAAPVAGEWHRLNPDQGNPAPQHERFTCAEGQVWRCSYDKVAEPTLHADGTVARFVGHTVTSRWECPAWFAAHCDDVVEVVRGKAHITLDDGTRFTVTEEFILTEVDGQEVLWVYIVDFGVAVPWYRTFDEAVLAAGFTPPYLFDVTNWPPADFIVVPSS
jgi:hypothetical protein